MAVIKYSGLVDQLRGKLNGTVFSRFNAGFNSYKKGQPSRWGSIDQQMLRKSFYQASQFWNSMPALNRQNWNYVASQITVTNRLGDQVHLTGYAYFMRFWQYKAFTVGTDNGYVYDTLEPAPTFELYSSPLIAEIVGSKYSIKSLTVTIILTSEAQTWSFVPIYISNPIRNEDGNYNNTKYLVGSIYIDQGTPVDTELFAHFEDLPLAESWHVYPNHYANVYARSVTTFTGRETQLQAVKISETLEEPAPPVWEISWSFSSDDTRYTELIPSGGDWIAGATGVWIAATNELLPGSAAEYNFELAISPNLFGSDIARPTEFDVPRPTLSGTLNSKNNSGPYYITPATIGTIQAFMNTNFTYTSGAGYQYQPVAIRIQRPADSVWSTWGYSNIWLPIF